MTAEIAILNKSAVALAADSAVTISTALKQEKIFDSEDKLFELSNYNPMGIMIYNSMSFLEAPLPSLIRKFRATCPRVGKVEDAADLFLCFLNEFGEKSPASVKLRCIEAIVGPIIDNLNSVFQDKLHKRLFGDGDEVVDVHSIFKELLDEEIRIYLDAFRTLEDASFVGNEGCVEITFEKLRFIRDFVSKKLSAANPEQLDKLVEIAKLSLQKNFLSRAKTGVVFAGFGDQEIFPTLVSYELDGVICDRLKYVKTNCVDIDREGAKAKVLPFAQKEMVERFLYGLDNEIQTHISSFCEANILELRKGLINDIAFESNDDNEEITKRAQEAEEAFLNGLKEKAFQKIRAESQAEIEDMVEFMPKPELAKMAEALVNLTSIKRRVSRGVETVGGPIDVAVISQAEGFVWVKRKHYFHPDLNSRYFERKRFPERPNKGD